MNIHEYLDNKKNYWKNKRQIYAPLYNYYTDISEYFPEVYNSEGHPYEFFFIRDIHSAHAPYEGTGKYFIYDRYNYGLKTHFYTHKSMLETMGSPLKKYGMFVESRAIVPHDYELLKKNKGLENEFDAIFTYDDRLLNEVKNACFMPFAAQIWYGKGNPDIIVKDQYRRKTENISITSSNKVWCELHKIRLELAQKCKINNWAKTFGTFDGGPWTSYDISLESFRYSIVIENYISDYFFTERLTSCFAAQTIPIYLGARKVEQFFNIDGIIVLSIADIDNIENVLRGCTEEYYCAHLSAVLDNYQRAMQYMNMQDYLYEHFLKKDN